MRTSTKLSFAFGILTLSGAFAFAQQKEKANSTPPATASEKAPTFSDDDKKKMAEIEQRPEIKDAIQTAWDAKRRAVVPEGITGDQELSSLTGGANRKRKRAMS